MIAQWAKCAPYLVKNPWLHRYLLCLDTFLCLLKRFKRFRSSVSIPYKILVIQWAHRGDVIIATSILPLLKETFPQAKIGMLIGSSAQEILHGHPLIDHLHLFDHPKVNRSKISTWGKIYEAMKQWSFVIKEIKKYQYDVSIDLSCFYPNSHILTWMANIPRRIGYSSGGGGPLLTDCFPWTGEKKHMSLYHLDLLGALGIERTKKPFLKSVLALPEPQLWDLVQKKWNLFEDYIIFHPYSGDASKHLDDEHWKNLVELASNRPYKIIFTGGSLEEYENIEKIIQEKATCINLAGQLSFRELQWVVKHARGLVCVDTMIGHLAAVYDIPSVIFFVGTSNPFYWKPASYMSLSLGHE